MKTTCSSEMSGIIWVTSNIVDYRNMREAVLCFKDLLKQIMPSQCHRVISFKPFFDLYNYLCSYFNNEQLLTVVQVLSFLNR